MNLRAYWKLAGGHIDIRVLMGIPGYTYACIGELRMTEKDFIIFQESVCTEPAHAPETWLFIEEG